MITGQSSAALTDEMEEVGRPAQRGPVQVHEPSLLQAVAHNGHVGGVGAGELVEATQPKQQVLKTVPGVLLCTVVSCTAMLVAKLPHESPVHRMKACPSVSLSPGPISGQNFR